MQESEFDWQSEFGTAHQGRPAAVLADGTEPKALVVDLGSGAYMHETSNWRVYDGDTLTAPQATSLRGACSCGWRGTTLLPIDWQAVDAECPDWEEPQGPHDDWKQHIVDVEHRAVPIPQDVADLLRCLRERLAVLADDAPLAALRIVGDLEHTITEAGAFAAQTARADDQSWDAIATGLGGAPPPAGGIATQQWSRAAPALTTLQREVGKGSLSGPCAEPSTPGPGKPLRSRNRRPATRYNVGKTVVSSSMSRPTALTWRFSRCLTLGGMASVSRTCHFLRRRPRFSRPGAL
ncbi:hypothetical protein [Streptomyces sp. NPDC059651]|uniref:hypothetical protein n=1 Tax=Streptomyces sp. NPDC059651 TaxID=3346897 RepID=UPI0036B69C41